jgi:hypothetical protein
MIVLAALALIGLAAASRLPRDPVAGTSIDPAVDRAKYAAR